MTLHIHYSDNTDIYEIGVDEAGRGPLFGRVYAAAVILPKTIEEENTFDFTNMKDSKKFTSKKKIKEVSEYIKSNSLSWGVAFESEKAIDKMNILQATQSAMHNAIKECLAKIQTQKKELLGGGNCHLLVDGNYFNSFIGFDKKTSQITSVPHTCVKGGDATYACIAAASILAKVARDEYIDEICDENPWLDEIYGIRSNKGYGAKKHMTAVREKGRSKWHRFSFAPCKTAQMISEININKQEENKEE